MSLDNLGLSAWLTALIASALALGVGRPPAAAPPVALGIESLTAESVHVHVQSRPAGLWLDSASATPNSDLVVLAPALVRVADSVNMVTLRLLDYPGSVRIHFPGRANMHDQRTLVWGRDIILSRTEDGFFAPVWNVYPLACECAQPNKRLELAGAAK